MLIFLELILGYNEHPNVILYMLLWNEINSKNCKFLKNKEKF